MQRIALLGGSFNPVHIGHIRLAIEAVEALKPECLELIPCATPPHKNAKGLLPFELRCQLVELAIKGIDSIAVNRLEGKRSGVSYTWDTLALYKAYYPKAELFFLLGGEDFNTLPFWHRGLEIPSQAHIVVVPRSGSDQTLFLNTIREHWPTATLQKTTFPQGALTYRLPHGGTFIHLPLPRLDISASIIRDKWILGKDISFLLPPAVEQALNEHQQIASICWKK